VGRRRVGAATCSVDGCGTTGTTTLGCCNVGGDCFRARYCRAMAVLTAASSLEMGTQYPIPRSRFIKRPCCWYTDSTTFCRMSLFSSGDTVGAKYSARLSLTSSVLKGMNNKCVYVYVREREQNSYSVHERTQNPRIVPQKCTFPGWDTNFFPRPNNTSRSSGSLSFPSCSPAP
jgi:hypothetical protein